MDGNGPVVLSRKYFLVPTDRYSITPQVYFLRITVRHRRCPASRKSLLRPNRPRLDCVCAKWNVADFRLAPSHFSHIGVQYLSSASDTFQVAAEHPPLKLLLAFDFDVAHDYAPASMYEH